MRGVLSPRRQSSLVKALAGETFNFISGTLGPAQKTPHSRNEHEGFGGGHEGRLMEGFWP